MSTRSRPSNPRTSSRRTLAQQRGDAAEDWVCAWLEARGWTIVTRNWRTRSGELDIVAIDAGTIVFVEVRSRGAGAWASGLQSLPVSKQRRCVRAAEAWLRAHPSESRPCRFDLVAVDGPLEGPEVAHVRQAFDGTSVS